MADEYTPTMDELMRAPHGPRSSGLNCTPRMRTLHGCTCWKSKLRALDAEIRRDQAEKDAEIAASAFLLHEMPTPEIGPFALQQRSADEAREQISAKILAKSDRSSETEQVGPRG